MKQNNENNERSAFEEAWVIMKKLFRAILVPILTKVVEIAEKIESKKAEKAKTGKAPKAKKTKAKDDKKQNLKNDSVKSENKNTYELKAPITVDTPAPRARRAEYPEDFKFIRIFIF